MLLTLMGAFCACMAFPALNFITGSVDFICVRVKVGTDSYDHECSPLYLNHEKYWSVRENEGWADAMQAGAIFGILAAAIGFLTFSVLLTASCFTLRPRRILILWIFQVVAAVLSILTLSAGGLDACKALGKKQQNPTLNCETDDLFIARGAGFMIAGFFCYVVAAVMTFFYFWEARKQHVRAAQAKKHDLSGGRPHYQQHPQHHQDVTEASAPPLAPGHANITKTHLADGSVRVEREYMDDTGSIIKEITIEKVSEDQPPVDSV